MNTSRRAYLCTSLVTLMFLLDPSFGRAADIKMNAGEWKAVRKVISDQRAALIAGDAEKAFAFAAPTIRRQVGSADRFMTMVLGGYEAIVSAQQVDFLEGDVVNAIVVQPVRLVGTDNAVRVALYTMERQASGEWRISGCQMAPSVGQMI